MRKEGSGLNKNVTDAVERIVGSLFLGVSPARSDEAVVQRAHDQGKCRIPLGDLTSWVSQLVAHLGLRVVQAEVPAPDHLGDVRLTLDDGSFVWIEVKAQTTKYFKELIQADWVREETDFLKLLYLTDSRFERLVGPMAADALRVDDRNWFSGWDLGSLWAADVALLTSRARRAVAGVRSPQDLQRFLSEKYVMHIARDGARVTRLDHLGAVQRALSGGQMHLDVQPGGQCDVRVWVGSGHAPRRGSIDFIYYVGYLGHEAVGRHKGTDYLIRSSDTLLVARP